MLLLLLLLITLWPVRAVNGRVEAPYGRCCCARAAGGCLARPLPTSGWEVCAGGARWRSRAAPGDDRLGARRRAAA